jgi:hypothetical protein
VELENIEQVSRGELAHRWAYRASLETLAALRFSRLAQRVQRDGFDPRLADQLRNAAAQEHEHIQLCTGIARRADSDVVAATLLLEEIAPASFNDRDRTIYEMVAFCCIAESANAAVVVEGIDDIEDPHIRRAARKILADEVEHSRIGWQFLASHGLDRTQLQWLGGYLPHMLRGTVRDDFFSSTTIVGDERLMQAYGTLPLQQRRQTFIDCMRNVVLAGLATFGVDTAPATDVVGDFERQLHT